MKEPSIDTPDSTKFGTKTPHLAIETTGRNASLCVLSGPDVLHEVSLAGSQRTASTLAPALAKALEWCENNDCFPKYLSVADGPGSFTGLRIGVTTAKTLCYALSLPLVRVDSVAAIAATIFVDHPNVDSLLVAINAYRGQVYAGRFGRNGLLGVDRASRPLTEGASLPATSTLEFETRVIDESEWDQILVSKPAGLFVAGDRSVFAAVPDSEFLARLSSDAVGVGTLGVHAALKSLWCDPLALVPRYLKASAAEEKAAEAKAAQ